MVQATNASSSSIFFTKIGKNLSQIQQTSPNDIQMVMSQSTMPSAHPQSSNILVAIHKINIITRCSNFHQEE